MGGVWYGTSHKLLVLVSTFAQKLKVWKEFKEISTKSNGLWIRNKLNVHMNEQMETLYLFCCVFCLFLYLLLWKWCLFSSGQEKRWKEFLLPNTISLKLVWFVGAFTSNWYFILAKTKTCFLTFSEQDGLISPLKWLRFYLIIMCIHCILR